jgi:hypothetical protein
MGRKKTFNWDKAFAAVAAHSERSNKKAAKELAKSPAPKVAPRLEPTSLDLGELQKRLRI